MNILVGDDNITADKDPKHVMKRCRNFVLHKLGVMINSFVITPTLLVMIMDTPFSFLSIPYVFLII